MSAAGPGAGSSRSSRQTNQSQLEAVIFAHPASVTEREQNAAWDALAELMIEVFQGRPRRGSSTQADSCGKKAAASG